VLAEHLGHLFVHSDIVGRDLIKGSGAPVPDRRWSVQCAVRPAGLHTQHHLRGEHGRHGHYRCIQHLGHRRGGCFAILFSFIGKIAAVIHGIPTPVMGGVCILLFGFIAASGLRMMVERKVDFTQPKNLILTAVTMISGLSGAAGPHRARQLKGMGLATVVAIITSLAFLIFEKLGLTNEK
jgi:uracil permease